MHIAKLISDNSLTSAHSFDIVFNSLNLPFEIFVLIECISVYHLRINGLSELVYACIRIFYLFHQRLIRLSQPLQL